MALTQTEALPEEDDQLEQTLTPAEFATNPAPSAPMQSADQQVAAISQALNSANGGPQLDPNATLTPETFSAPSISSPAPQTVAPDQQQAPTTVSTNEAPAPPQLTGDFQKDAKLLTEYRNKLTQFATETHKRNTEEFSRRSSLAAERAGKEAAAAKVQEEAAKTENARRNAERQQQQKQIADAVLERQKREADLTKGFWADKSTGQKILAGVAGALGTFGAGFQNVAAAQLGQVSHAQNEAINTINQLMDQDYKQKRDRLQSASQSVLEARYGLKDSEDLHHAILNDLDSDRAAKFRTIAAEAEAELRKQGLSDEQIKENALYQNSLNAAATAEQGILEREQQRKAQEKESASRLAITRAQLGLQREQVEATKELRLANAVEKRDKDTEKKQTALDARTFRDPESGEPIGLAASPRVIDKLGEQNKNVKMYQESVEKLAQHIERYGYILNPLSAEAIERESLAANAQALGRSNKGIQASDAGQKLEHMMIGGTGVLGKSIRTADPKVLRDLSEEATVGARRKLLSTLSPLPGDEHIRLPDYLRTKEEREKDSKMRVETPEALKTKTSFSKAVPSSVVNDAIGTLTDPKSSAEDKQEATELLIQEHVY